MTTMGDDGRARRDAATMRTVMMTSSLASSSLASSSLALRRFRIHDVRTYDALVAAAPSTSSYKKITFVRHAEGWHNVGAYNDALNFDAKLTPRGEAQCAALAAARVGEGAELLVTSSMTRCVQTAALSFPHLLPAANSNSNSPSTTSWVAREDVRETVNYWCDRRRALDDLMGEVAGVGVDFSACTVEDEIWNKYEAICGPPEAWTKHRESCDLYSVAMRAREFFAWLETRPEEHVVVSTHSAFLRALFSYGHSDGVRGAPEQLFCDVKDTALGVPVVTYENDDDGSFERAMRADYANCEHRTCVVDFTVRAA